MTNADIWVYTPPKTEDETTDDGPSDEQGDNFDGDNWTRYEDLDLYNRGDVWNMKKGKHTIE
jgi:hypothetical protein